MCVSVRERERFSFKLRVGTHRHSASSVASDSEANRLVINVVLLRSGVCGLDL